VVTAGWGDSIWLPRSHLLVNSIPHAVNDLLVVETLKDTVAANQEEIVVVFQLETENLRVTNDNILIASISWPLCFNVAESARNGQSAGEHSQRALNI